MNRTAYIITFVGDKQQPNDGCLAPDTAPENIYTVNGHESERYKGLLTGDAPMQYLMQKAGEKAERISVIAIVSNKVYQKNGDAGSLYEIFRDNLDNFAGALGITDKYDRTSLFPVFYDFDESTGKLITDTNVRTNSIINQIYRLIIGSCPDAEKSVYIDFTSGLRDASYLMTSVIQFLKVYGIHLKKIVYSNREDKKIYSILHITAITDLIQAVNAFGLTGNVKQLREFFDDSYIIDKIGEENSGELADMKKLLDSFDRFLGCIAINNVNDIDDCKREIEKDMNRLCDSENSPNMYIAMFARLFGIIRKQFFLDGSGEISYPNMIRWCLNHDLINQALTLYVEKMPEEYFKSAFIKSIYDPVAAAKKEDKPSYGKSMYADGFYSGVFENAICSIKLKKNTYPQDLEMRILREIITEFKDQVEKEIKEQENKNKKIARNIKGRFQKGTSKLFRKKYPEYAGDGIPMALQRISNTINNIFDRDGNLKFHFCCYDEQFVGNTSSLSYLNRVVKTYPKIIHSYLINNRHEYEKLEVRNKSPYLKKIDAISDLFSCAEMNDSNIRLGNIMKYYLYVKIMRNRINHAQDDAQTSGTDLMAQEEALTELGKDSYGLMPLDTAFDFETIKKMLLKGLELPIPD
ncbi:TM1812 family CRISPR-associated protein [Succinimonas sp.]|uniref:TM1812 family CRISPR-associated protein n=1 Tax=Succinimonas sp. TaxID=1936151 RepID=UPI00386682FA